jgi:hypothetical protein
MKIRAGNIGQKAAGSSTRFFSIAAFFSCIAGDNIL